MHPGVPGCAGGWRVGMTDTPELDDFKHWVDGVFVIEPHPGDEALRTLRCPENLHGSCRLDVIGVRDAGLRMVFRIGPGPGAFDWRWWSRLQGRLVLDDR